MPIVSYAQNFEVSRAVRRVVRAASRALSRPVALSRRAAIAAPLLLGCVLALAAAGCRDRAKSDTQAAQTASSQSIDALDAPDDTQPLPSAPAPRTATAGGVDAPVPAGAPCAPARPHAAGDETATLRSGGVDRTYILHVPKSYDGSRGVPLVVNLHGFGSNARQQAIYSGLPAKGDAEGFITVTPNGTGTPQRWALGGGSDIDFARDLLDSLEAQLCIDASRVYAAGISNGSGFAQQLACAMPDRIAAVGAVAAMVYPLRCAGTRAIPIIAFFGTEDPCVPYTGGTSKCGLMLPIPAVEDAARDWAKHNNCDPSPANANVSANVRTITYISCQDDAFVVLVVIEGGGHTWPGSIDVPRLGATTHEISATDQMWRFFAAHPMPGR